ncbi:MAG: hypothetical protein PSU94_00245 [Lacunisphaera sp.]|nr:hypothetical protein [Lacunisphaera sp.]
MSKTSSPGLTPSRERRLRRVTVRVEVEAKTGRTAARIARRHAGQPLAAVLAAFVGELAQADARPGPWSQNLVAVWLLTHAWPRAGTEARHA